MVNKQKKLLDEFIENFLQAIKENNSIFFHKHIASEETSKFVYVSFSQSLSEFDHFLNRLNKVCENLNSFSKLEIIKQQITQVADITPSLNTIDLKIKLSNSQQDTLTVDFESIYIEGERIHIYPGKESLYGHYHNHKEYEKRIKEQKEAASKLKLTSTKEDGVGYEVGEFLEKYGDIVSDEHNYLDNHILFFEDDLNVDGNLDLDELEFSIVVKGNLVVDGDITNYVAEYGATLIVLGKTHAKNIIAGGAVIDLNDTYATGFVIGHYNDGSLMISKLNKGILYSNDHNTYYSELGEDAYSFTDFKVTNENEFTLDDAEKLFVDENGVFWLDIDEIEHVQYDYDDLIIKIKRYQQQKEKDKSNYESIELSTFKEVEHSLNREVLDMRHSGYNLSDFLYDLGLKKSASVKILHGNQKIDGNFSLNFEDIEADCLLVRGDLEVSGTIYSFDKTVAKLAVLGEVKCNNFAILDTHVLAKKGINATQTFLYRNSSTKGIKLSVGFHKIASPIVIFVGNIGFYDSIDKNAKTYSNRSDIRNADEFEDLIQILLPEFYQEGKNIKLYSKKIINALVENKVVYDTEKLHET